ncbi:ABC transporter permease [Cellulomonas sp. P24]|uniref:ABC transporter permease n=1 Tax=Cellulomonas sp. P24 TaxID=2885206 RepID=UPI00216B5025|nr:ABC transporter permease [Cellulomonas sp. P24]MCR6493066.1 ABC transporter permease [Cellulomonas sp. P24]
MSADRTRGVQDDADERPRLRETVAVIARREITVRLHDRAFRGSTLFMLVVVALAVAVPAFIQGQTPRFTVAVSGSAAQQVVGAATTLAADAQKSSSSTVFGVGKLPSAIITTRPVESTDEAEELVRDGTVSAAVIGDDIRMLQLIAKGVVPDVLGTLVETASAQLQISAAAADAGLTSAQLRAMLNPTPPTTTVLDARTRGSVPPQLLVAVVALLFYLSVLTFGVSIAQSVVEEKQSRVVELLVAAVPVRWLLAGKVIGSTVLALAQILLLLAVGIAGAAVTGRAASVGQLFMGAGWFVVFFVLGFVLLACLWAVAGSLVSRHEELQSTTIVMQVLVMVPLVAALLATEPGIVQTVLSYIPLTAPLLMPERVILGDVAAWEPVVSAVLLLAFAMLSVGLGARLYERSVLHTSSRLHLRQAWRRARARA